MKSFTLVFAILYAQSVIAHYNTRNLSYSDHQYRDRYYTSNQINLIKDRSEKTFHTKSYDDNSTLTSGELPYEELKVLYNLFQSNVDSGWLWRSLNYEDENFKSRVPWNFTSWTVGNHSLQPCAEGALWEGVDCICQGNKTPSCHVSRLYLSGYGLSGSISDIAFENLPYLAYIDLSNNNLTGWLPHYSLSSMPQLLYLSLKNNSLTGPLVTMDNDFEVWMSELASSLVHLDLSMNYLTGSLPDSMTDMPSLKYLILSTNYLNGRLPNDIGRLQHTLQYLNLDANNISGRFPSSVTDLYKLRVLKISVSAMSGTIPDDIGRLKELEEINISFNLMTGTIPNSMSQLTKLYSFSLQGFKKLHGPFPAWIDRLENLRIISFYNNHLTGSLPEEISKLKLAALFLSENYFSGAIPGYFGKMSTLQILDLAGNRFVGTIPSFSELTSLKVLNLYNNALTGTIPAELSKIQSLQNLIIFNNLLTSTVPESLQELTELKVLGLGLNLLTGSVPSFLGHMSNLTSLILIYNFFTGTIPDTFGPNWLNMETLLFGGYNYQEGTYIHGTLPRSLCQMRNLRNVVIWATSLSGTIPECLFNKLEIVSIGNNPLLVGALPNSIHRLQNLNILSIDSVNFTGTIPESLYDIQKLTYLHIAKTSIGGTISESISKLTKLNYLALADNNLHGTLPVAFKSLEQLSDLVLKGNNFHGRLDGLIDVKRQQKLTTIDVGDNQLTGTIPADLFTLPSLSTFSAYSNCLSPLHLPESFCNSSLRTLVLDGMHTASSCRRPVFFSKSIYLPDFSTNDDDVNRKNIMLLECLISSKRSELETLHMSGIGLKGRLSDDIVLSDQLTSLSLSHNQLSGEIPTSMQRKEWFRLDLSYNYLNGELLEGYNNGSLYSVYRYYKYQYQFEQPDESEEAKEFLVALNNNRLSGKIPKALHPNTSAKPSFKNFRKNLFYHDYIDKTFNFYLRDYTTIDVLDGNLFRCSYSSKDELPALDKAVENYDCGSNSFDIAYYTWLGLIVALTILMLAIVIYVKIAGQKLLIVWRDLNEIKSMVMRHYLLMTESSKTHTSSDVHLYDRTGVLQALGETLHVFGQFKFFVCLCILYMVVVIVPTTSLLSIYGGNHKSYKSQYGWSVSFAYKTSWEAGVTMLLVSMLTVFLLCIYWPKRHQHYQVEDTKLDDSGSVTPPATITTSTPTSLDKPLLMICKWIIVILVELALVGGMNFLLVYVSINGSEAQRFQVQLAMVIFDLVWTIDRVGAFASYLHGLVNHEPWMNLDERHNKYFDVKCNLKLCLKMLKLEEKQFHNQVAIAILTQICIPLIVVACVNSNCFYDVLVAPLAVSSYYKISYCKYNLYDSKCYETFLYFISSYQPFFSYSYQCSAFMIVYLTPSIVYACMVDAFILPVLKVIVARYLSYKQTKMQNNQISQNQIGHIIQKICHKILGTALLQPITYKHTNTSPKQGIVNGDGNYNVVDIVATEQQSDNINAFDNDSAAVTIDCRYTIADYCGQKYFSATEFSIELCIYLLLMLTFGMTFPPVGIAIAVTLLAEIYFTEYILLRFVRKMSDSEKISIHEQTSGKEGKCDIEANDFNHRDVIIQDVKYDHDRLYKLHEYRQPSSESMDVTDDTKNSEIIDDLVNNTNISTTNNTSDNNIEHSCEFAGAESCLRALALQCTGLSERMSTCKWPLIVTASLFYCMFVMDALGSDRGMAESYWAFILLVIWPILLYLIFDHSKISTERKR